MYILYMYALKIVTIKVLLSFCFNIDTIKVHTTEEYASSFDKIIMRRRSTFPLSSIKQTG